MDIKPDADVSGSAGQPGAAAGSITDVSREKSHKAACLARLCKAMELAMISSANYDNVVRLQHEIEELWESLVKTHNDCLQEIVNTEEKLEMQQSFKRMTVNHHEMRGRVQEWICKCKAESKVDDVCSNASSSSREATLRRKVAELKLSQLRKRRSIELQQRQLQLQLEEEELCADIDRAALEETFYNDEIKREINYDTSHNIEQTAAQSTADRDYRVADPGLSYLNHEATPWPNQQQDTLLHGIQVISNTIQESFNLPKPEILTFSSNPADYCKFIRNFETNVESKIADDRIKLCYLIQYCSGDAKRSIEDCVVLTPEEGYKRAKQILQTRYGKPHLVARSHVERLINGQPLKANDVQGLMELSLEMEKCEITLSQIGFISDINNTENLRKIVKRLPMHIRSKWVEKASYLIETGQEPNFKHLLNFVQSRALVANTMYGQDLAREPKSESRAKDSKKGFGREKVTTLSVQSESKVGENVQRILSCVYCHEKHRLKDCDKFKLVDLVTKKSVIRKHRMCDNCLNFKHFAKFCRIPSACEIPGCTEKHHTMLHPRSEDVTGSCAATKAETTGNKVSLRILPVIVQNGSKEVRTYALLDAGSDVTLCSSKLVKKLRAKGKSICFNITTVNQTSEQIKGLEVKLNVSSLDGLGPLTLNRVLSVERLPISATSVPDSTDLRKWEHLADVSLPRLNQDEVELLIGSDIPEAFWVEEERRGKRGEPYAIKTMLGWTVIGPTGKASASSNVNVNFQQADINQHIHKLWTTDFPDYADEMKTGMSQDDRRALATMERTLCKVDGHYMIGMPWRDKQICLPNNRSLAVARLNYLKRKLQKNADLHRQYTDTVQSYIDNGYSKRLSDSELERNRHGKVWYLPHHPVINPGVLMRFREEEVAIVADIEAMFHQVKVNDTDRDALRFLWWPNGDLNNTPEEHCMTVHLFGATSSPSCVAYSLKCAVRENANDYDEETVKSVQRNMYVDDLLKSVSNVHVAVKIVGELRDMLSRGGFKLTKWITNSKQVTDAIPESERAKPAEIVDLENSSCLERTLGLQWNIIDDCFVFDVKMKEKPETRRGILSVASSLYDPLGLVAPVTLVPKLIIQNACRQGLQWDEPVCESDVVKWRNWLVNLDQLACIHIKRCMKPQGLDPSSTSIELHVFSDASEIAYGAAAYLRVYDRTGNSKCSLVMGKSRLAPIKSISIPRLELAAAVVAVRLFRFIKTELDLKIDKCYFWTDSMIVLGYIRNTSKRFKTFVANRLSIIHEGTTPSDWRYVPTDINPADLASRGVHPSDTSKLTVWLSGPDFLLEDENKWPSDISYASVADNDEEVKIQHFTNTVQTRTQGSLEELITRYSDWHKLQRSVAWLLRFKTYMLHKYLKNKEITMVGDLTASEIENATHVIIQAVQRTAFERDIFSLETTGQVPRSSSLVKLCPVYNNGILRVGGRLQYSESSEDFKHPIILPSKHHVTDLIVRKCHQEYAHMGAHHILSQTRLKYWIIQGLKTVKTLIRKCIDCRRRYQRPEVQQMAPLPGERLTPDKPPFTYVGVDYFGPLYVKVGRSQQKRYGCLFTCLTTRAVHIEIAYRIDTDSFLCALQRFISRRGKPTKLFSDNGSNLTSGEKELRESIAEWNQSHISRQLQQKEIEWHFNPPYASHMGGVWERLIRIVKNAMKSVVKQQLLSDEALQTLACETEKVVNDRPITQVSDDCRDPEPLSPNKLLLLRPNTCVPLGIFDKDDNYGKRWWRQVQYLANLFWRRWTREYILALQIRQKWQGKRRNLAVNDLVLVCDEMLPRGKWPLALVIEVNTGRDGLVRSCRVRMNGSIKVRPVTKLCILEQETL